MKEVQTVYVDTLIRTQKYYKLIEYLNECQIFPGKKLILRNLKKTKENPRTVKVYGQKRIKKT